MTTPAQAPACPICNGFGVLEKPDGQLVACACREPERVLARARGAHIPDRYRSCSLATFNGIHESQKAAKALAQRFVAAYPAVESGLLITGPAGVGKTHLAVAILAELVESKFVRGLFCDFTDLLERIQATYTPGSDENADEILEPCRETELLILDELGARRPTDWARDVLYGLLNTRYNRRRLTVITTNFGDQASQPGAETLEMRVGTPVRSRLAEMCVFVPMTGPDYRREVRPARLFS
ncbi:MAG: ATP-binding protein [Acidobacteria bacterium]|nr:ATP-binding protein [Acidobacteriota bacterium]